MRLVAFVVLASGLMLNAAPASDAPSHDVTVLVDFEKPHSPESVDALRTQLSSLLAPMGLKIHLQLRSELPPAPEFSDLVIFKMKGSCSMKALPIGALSDERGPLAMAYSSDGEVLHFGEVECDRVRECLQRVLGRGSPDKHQALLGSALALVIAHEVYHMIANSAVHTRDGITKASLSAEELLAGDLTIPKLAQEAVHQRLLTGR